MTEDQQSNTTTENRNIKQQTAQQQQRINNMASPNYTLPSPDISDVMNLLCTMKKENDEAMKEILTKLTRIEDDNRKLRQELLELKSSQKLNNNNVNNVKVPSRKLTEPEVEAEDQHGTPNNKKVRVSAMSLPELVHALDPPASFNTLDDDCLGNVLDFVGKKCYSAFGRVNKRCHEMFCSKGLPKETYLYGYAPLHIIQHLILQQLKKGMCHHRKVLEAVLHYNRRDILEWLLADESGDGYLTLKGLCDDAIIESRLDILHEVFQRANEQQLEYLRDCGLCFEAAHYGKLECLKLLRENKCELDILTWTFAKHKGHDHILEYLRNNGYPSKWQN